MIAETHKVFFPFYILCSTRQVRPTVCRMAIKCNSIMQTPFSHTPSMLSKCVQTFLHDDRGVDIKPDYGNVASVVFSSPQVAQVGVNEDKAVEEYGDVDFVSSTFS